MDDGQLAAKLSEVIDSLARMRVFLSQTDHLRDRELYTLLWGDTLREPVKDMPLDDSSAWHIELLSGGSEDDTLLYMKYYADEETRRQWLADFPDDKVPPHEEPPRRAKPDDRCTRPGLGYLTSEHGRDYRTARIL